ncbi:hypothetical protein LCGC14_1634310 [marine sediment metagenome]|uniref:Uncharacterized protein n=1 Tax=marine sediment metagenome TaxID=412755 RepID=A0A0F9I219_9ZZZZ
MANVGRPSKLTSKVRKRLLDAIRTGNRYEAACTYAGITYTTLRRWILTGEEAKSGKYREFCEALTRAEAEAEVRMVAQWQKHMPEDWRAIRDFLERRHPDAWGKKLAVTLEDKRKVVDELIAGLSEKAQRQVLEALAEGERL